MGCKWKRGRLVFTSIHAFSIIFHKGHFDYLWFTIRVRSVWCIFAIISQFPDTFWNLLTPTSQTTSNHTIISKQAYQMILFCNNIASQSPFWECPELCLSFFTLSWASQHFPFLVQHPQSSSADAKRTQTTTEAYAQYGRQLTGTFSKRLNPLTG